MERGQPDGDTGLDIMFSIQGRCVSYFGVRPRGLCMCDFGYVKGGGRKEEEEEEEEEEEWAEKTRERGRTRTMMTRERTTRDRGKR